MKTVEPKPEYEPPPLIPIGRPVLGWKPWKPEQFKYIPPFYQRAPFILLIGFLLGLIFCLTCYRLFFNGA